VDEIAAIERAMVQLRRSQTRRTLARLSRERGVSTSPPDAVFALLDAIEAGASTVTEAASALGIDQPRASRLATQAHDAKLLRRTADQSDGRRSPLVLTPAGRRALERAQTFRRRIVTEALAGWQANDRATLARLLTRFVDDIVSVARPD
jgi:DNA-binding MarR family transcriptional regulator